MNENLCKKVIENKSKFIPALFTERQISLLQKYLKKKQFTKTEQTYLYSTIKKKIDALQSLEEQFYTRGDISTMIPERVEQAKKILKEINKEKAFISGSFLFSKKYNDIDIFVVGKRRKQYHEGKKNYVCIREDDLKKPIFFSAYNYSITTFNIKNIKPFIKRPDYNSLQSTYEITIKWILEKNDQKETRDIVFYYYIFIKNQILNAYILSKICREVESKEKEEKINVINNMVKNLILKLYSPKYLYSVQIKSLKNLKELIKEYPKANNNLKIYYKLSEEIKNECRRIEAET
ncbi:hypothetical protein HZA96_00150 [Candidatus Woesearchaeota archaeon]|nr:hypothetical protein [Candidatus Woesearchaeota archaeon]